jgi:hypothetical protein
VVDSISKSVLLSCTIGADLFFTGKAGGVFRCCSFNCSCSTKFNISCSIRSPSSSIGISCFFIRFELRTLL